MMYHVPTGNAGKTHPFYHP